MLRINRILAPFDFSTHAENSLMHASDLADFYEAKLYVLYVLEVIATPTIDEKGHIKLRTDRDPSIIDPSRAALEQRLKDLGVVAEVRVERGPAAEEIKKFAEEKDIDLIVLASHGITGLRARLMGSVTRVVLEDASCPILFLKSYGKSLLEESGDGEDEDLQIT
ncbi:MAG: universal stress protein [Rubricoccaceae bacterium]|nr:universal stress protein [Rubricoccaceae bacterium]